MPSDCAPWNEAMVRGMSPGATMPGARDVMPIPFPCSTPHPNTQPGQPYRDSNQAPPANTIAQRRYVKDISTGSAALTVDSGIVIVPPLYQAAAQTPTGEGDPFLTGIVATYTVPRGYIMLSLDVFGSLEEPAWSDLIQWAVYVNNTPMRTRWVGSIFEPVNVPFSGDYYEGSTVNLCAMVIARGWWTGADPITNLVIGNGEIHPTLVSANAYAPSSPACQPQVGQIQLDGYRTQGGR